MPKWVKDEWYTPQPILDAARAAMGSIDLDPASCLDANARVQATEFYDASDDGLTREWKGNVWVNPPFGERLTRQFHDRLLAQLSAGNVEKACFLSNMNNGKYVRDIFAKCSAVCMIGKTNGWRGLAPEYLLKSGRNTHDANWRSVGPNAYVLVAGYGIAPVVFAEAFESVGPVLIRPGR